MVWLERSGFRFRSRDRGDAWTAQPLDYWLAQWKQINVPASARAAFRWPQLPEMRDLQPNEPVGGNLSFARRTGDFDLEIHLATGKDRQGTPLMAHFSGLSCP